MKSKIIGFVRKVLLVKIWFTLVAWAFPLILIPSCCLDKAGLPAIQPPLFGALLGVSYLSLAICYYNGLLDTYRDKFPMTAVAVGIVSNGLSAFFLTIYLWPNLFPEFDNLAFFFLFGSLVITTGICYGLARSLILYAHFGFLHSK